MHDPSLDLGCDWLAIDFQYVRCVHSDWYWKEYGINEGDVIKKINGIEINSLKDIDEIIN